MATFRYATSFSKSAFQLAKKLKDLGKLADDVPITPGRNALSAATDAAPTSLPSHITNPALGGSSPFSLSNFGKPKQSPAGLPTLDELVKGTGGTGSAKDVKTLFRTAPWESQHNRAPKSIRGDLGAIGKTIRSSLPGGGKFNPIAFTPNARPGRYGRLLNKLPDNMFGNTLNQAGGKFWRTPFGRRGTQGLVGYGAYKGGEGLYNLPDTLAGSVQDEISQYNQQQFGSDITFNDKYKQQLGDSFRQNAWPVAGQMFGSYLPRADPRKWGTPLSPEQAAAKEQSDVLWRLTGNELFGTDVNANAGTTALNYAKSGPVNSGLQTALRGGASYLLDGENSFDDPSGEILTDYLRSLSAKRTDTDPNVPNMYRPAFNTPVTQTLRQAAPIISKGLLDEGGDRFKDHVNDGVQGTVDKIDDFAEHGFR